MKTTIKYRLPRIAAVIFTLLLSSCMKEDMSDCLEEIRVYFTFSIQSINPADVDRMHLYVFNSDGYFVSEYRDDNISNFGANYYMNISDLLPGNYRFIAWGGKDERYYSTAPTNFVAGKTTFGEALLMLEHPGNIVSSPPHHLFHSELPATVVTTQRLLVFYMPLVQLSNTINISTVGLPADANSYSFNITDINCSYNFDSSFATHNHEPFTYTASCTKDNAHQLHSTLNVLRLSADRRTPQLQVYNKTADTVLYPVGEQSGDLIGLILSAYPQNNFDTTHTYDIVLTFAGDGSTGFDVNISINGWQVQEGGGELIE